MIKAFEIWLDVVDCLLIGTVGLTAEETDFNWYELFINEYEAKDAVAEYIERML